jgi:predicted NAD/FAD-binding protein
VVALQSIDLGREGSFVLGEEIGGDLVVEEGLEQLVALASQGGERTEAGRLRRAASGALRLASEFVADRFDQVVVGT